MGARVGIEITTQAPHSYAQEGTITFFNHQSERTLGMGLDKVLGVPSIHMPHISPSIAGSGKAREGGGSGVGPGWPGWRWNTQRAESWPFTS